MPIKTNLSIINFPLLLFIFCFSSSLAIFLKIDGNSIYQWLFLLPLLHGVIILFNYNSFQKHKLSWTKCIVLFSYTIRNVVTPLFFALGGFNYVGIHTKKITTESDLIRATLLMSYETLIIFCGMSYYYNKIETKERMRLEIKNNKQVEKRIIPGGLTLYSLFCVIIVGILILSVAMVPSIRKTYKNMWSTDAISLISSAERSGEEFVGGTLNRLLYSFFIMFFALMQILVIVQIIYWIKNRIKSKSIGIIVSILVSGAIITLFVSESTIMSIYLCIIVYIYTRDIYSEYKQKIDFFAGIGALTVILMLIIAKVTFWNVGNENFFTTSSSLFNAYFPGVFSISKTWYIETPGRIATLFTDIIDSFPLRSIIPNISNGQRLVTYFNIAANTDFQIIPFVTQVYYYFSFLGPFIQLFFVFCALKAESRMDSTDNYLLYVAYVTVIVLFGFGIVSRNITNILKLFWKIILPCFLLAKCSNINLLSLKRK